MQIGSRFGRSGASVPVVAWGSPVSGFRRARRRGALAEETWLRKRDVGSVGSRLEIGVSRMRIGVMLRSIGSPGGITVYTRNLLGALLRIDRGHDYVLMYREEEDLGLFEDVENAREILVRAPTKLLWDQVAVPWAARREEVDLIFNPKLTVPLITSCDTVVAMHGAEQFAVREVFPWHDRLYYQIANPIYCRAASAVIVMTEIGAGDVVRYMGASPERVHAIHESYNEDCRVLEEEVARERLAGYELPPRFFLFTGGITPLKNIGNLLRAFHRVREEIPQDLVIAGFKRWKYSGDLALVDDLGLQNRVHFLGFVPDDELVALYNSADAFVMPSLYEGFGMPALEAMACGCPVITTKAGCTPEVVGDAAVLVDPYDPGEIAAAMRAVVTDTDMREGLATRGLRRVRFFSWEKCAGQTLDLFEMIARGSNPG